MARQQTVDRNIPHLRDIFSFGSKWENTRGQADEKAPGHDSAVSVGSTSGEEESPKNSKKKKSRRRDNSKTLTESDVKHLERHLSMKKTIRKKIMRDLQQAFVEDPNEFRVDDIPPEQLKAEINIQSLSFGTPSQKQGRTRGNAESTFLDMLRGGGKPDGSISIFKSIDPPLDLHDVESSTFRPLAKSFRGITQRSNVIRVSCNEKCQRLNDLNATAHRGTRFRSGEKCN